MSLFQTTYAALRPRLIAGLKAVVVLAGGILLASGTWAQDRTYADISVALTKEISVNLDDELSGPHGQLFKDVMDRHADSITYRLESPNHAYESFYRQRYVCVTPDSRIYYENSEDYIDSLPFNSVNWVIVQRKGSAPIGSSEGLKGLTVASFYDPEEIVNIVPQEGVTYSVKADYLSTLLKVALARVDVAVIPDVEITNLIAENPRLSNLSITISPVLARVPETIMCHDTRRGREIIELVNDSLKAIQSGSGS